jgi:tetratricopeptide (TPR) repeat protein
MAHEHPTQLSRRGLFQLMAGRTPDAEPEASADQDRRGRAEAAFASGDMAGAAQDLRVWLRTSPGDDAARMLLGRALYAMERHVQAMVEFERVARRVDGHPAWLFLCLCRLRRDQAAKALEAFSAWDAANPAAPGDAAREALAARLRTAVAPDLVPAAVAALEQALDAGLGLDPEERAPGRPV